MCYKCPVAAAESDNRKPLSKNQLVIAVLVLLLIVAVGAGLYILLKSDKKTGSGPRVQGIGPILMTPAQLKGESKLLGAPIYWAGPLPGYSYEFTRSIKGFYYVRYLEKGLQAGKKGANWLVVSTYPFIGAYQGLKKASHGASLSGTAGSIYYVNPSFHSSVLVAWQNVDYQVEVYDPKPAIAATIASSGQVVPVRG